METRKLTLGEVHALAEYRAGEIKRDRESAGISGPFAAYCIPRGGVPAGLAIQHHIPDMRLTSNPAEATIFIDDIIDSAETMWSWQDRFPDVPFYALIDKTDPRATKPAPFYIFPWEDESGGVADNIRRLIQYIGDDPKREGLLETPNRAVKAWAAWCSGYGRDPAKEIKVFEDGGENYDEMVIVRDLPLYSHCEHHMAPIFGTVSIGYIPAGKILGLSKLARITDIYARRLQVQERLTNQIAEALWELLNPLGVGVIIRARHLCMESRGICQQGHHTITSAMRGALMQPAAREEFINLCR